MEKTQKQIYEEKKQKRKKEQKKLLDKLSKVKIGDLE